MYKVLFFFLFLSFLNASNPPVLNEEIPVDDTAEGLDIDFKFTGLHRYMNLNDEDHGYTFLLTEGEYKGENFNLDLGVSLENYEKSTFNINNLSVSFLEDNYKIKIGKFVTSLGVMDYLTSYDDLNPRRLSFYNEENKNISRYATWMLEATTYFQDEISLSLHVQKYNDKLDDYFYITNYLLFNNFIPFLLNSGEKSDMQRIAEEVFAPVYDRYGQPVLEPYAENMYDLLPSDIENSAVGMNFLLNADDYTLGALWLNSYSKLPLLKPTEELLEGLEDVIEENKETFIQDYFSKNNVNTMIEHFRYNKLGVYFETTVDDFGFRGELTYQDKIPVLNELSREYSLALGVDYKGFGMYNSLELKENYISTLEQGFYQGVLVTKLDSIELGFVDLKLENDFYYIKYNGEDYQFLRPSVGFEYKNMEVTLEYYYSSDDTIIDDSFMCLFRMSF